MLKILMTLMLMTFPSTGNAEYGSKIPTLPKDSVLYHAKIHDCNPTDYESNDPHFFIVLAHYWNDEKMYAAVFYRNDYVKESGLTNPSAMYYGNDETPTVFIRVVDTVERFDGFKPFRAKYPDGICDIPRDEI